MNRKTTVEYGGILIKSEYEDGTFLGSIITAKKVGLDPDAVYELGRLLLELGSVNTVRPTIDVIDAKTGKANKEPDSNPVKKLEKGKVIAGGELVLDLDMKNVSKAVFHS